MITLAPYFISILCRSTTSLNERNLHGVRKRLLKVFCGFESITFTCTVSVYMYWISQELEFRSLYHFYSLRTKRTNCHYVMTLSIASKPKAHNVITYSLKTKSTQCHYVMTLFALGFEAKEVIRQCHHVMAV